MHALSNIQITNKITQYLHTKTNIYLRFIHKSCVFNYLLIQSVILLGVCNYKKYNCYQTKYLLCYYLSLANHLSFLLTLKIKNNGIVILNISSVFSRKDSIFFISEIELLGIILSSE